MTAPTLDLTPLWTLVLGLAVFLYVLLDGFDLGVGMLFGLAPDTRTRNLVMNAIAPIWDGNETWLVLGVIGLMAAFPLAFAIIIPALYFPISLMLLALVFRGVSFEFRYRDLERKTLWDHGFAFGSGVATFSQGVVLGAFIQGFKIDGRHFTGSSIDCFTPFSFLTGVALVFGYGLLGAGWLILKTEDELNQRARRLARPALIGVTVSIAVVSCWTPLADPVIFARWFNWPNRLYLAPVPVLTLALALLAWRAIGRPQSQISPFLLSIGLFALSFVGIAISLWPMIVPHRYSIWQAAASPSTQAFLLLGTVTLLPIILMYTAWSYWVFRGKVRADLGYH
jgi:cytochrome d ubiquinol oxidase subunit II